MSGSTTKSMVGFLGVIAVLVGLAGVAHAVKPNPPGKQAGKFVVLGTGDVLDVGTSLRWQQTPGTPGDIVSNCDYGNYCKWQDAVDYCAALGDGSRLPEIKELISLVDYSVASPGLVLPVGHPFLSVQPAFYWSATADARNPTRAWIVDIGNGVVVALGKDVGVNHHAWCVR